ncbi:hypothetical protein AVEN_60902-1 [Araneus ventricosus]|uniref:Uncharacterized protein n=1 Tax=Araneus ventricosus TaxID=182803 RepID=A0A4Y2SBR4_ARAVE|nr:hypothetical protein AVEN_60902-1 [Araneus ventricosus]
MDSSNPFPLFSSLWVVGNMNSRPFISRLSPKGLFNDHSPNCLIPAFEQQPAEIRPTSIEVAWPVTAGLGVRVSIHIVTEMHTFDSGVRHGNKILPLNGYLIE